MIQVDHIKFDYIRRDEQDNVVAVEECDPGCFLHGGTGRVCSDPGTQRIRQVYSGKDMKLALLVPEEGTIWVDSLTQRIRK